MKSKKGHTPYFEYAPLQYARFRSYFEVNCTYLWDLFLPFLTFLAIFSISLRVTPPKLFWDGKLSSKKFAKGHTPYFQYAPLDYA